MRYYAILVLLVFLPFKEGWSQSSFSFVRVAPEVLSNANVRCFYKDSQGYMWIGTEDALLRYDGAQVFRYLHQPNDNTSIAHSTVNTLIEDNQNRLWIGTAQGLCLYNRELDNFVNIDSIPDTKNYLNNRYITALEFDSHGRLWIGTHEGGINVYDTIEKEFKYIIDPPQRGMLPSSNFINALLNVGDTMWCGTKGELLLYNVKTLERISIGNLNPLSNSNITVIKQDTSGDLWIGNALGSISRVFKENGKYHFKQIVTGNEFGESANRLLSFAFDQEMNLYAGGENSGFNFISNHTFKVQRLLTEEGNIKRLPTNSIQVVYSDNLGFVWIGTINSGVFLIDTNKKTLSSHIVMQENQDFSISEVRGFAEDSHKNIWVAFYGSGLARLSASDNVLHVPTQWNKKIGTKNLTSIWSDKKDQLWLGSAGKGVYKINPQTNELLNYEVKSDGFGNNQVFCLYEDRHGVIWAGTWGSGLFYFNEAKQAFVSATEYNAPNHIPNTAYVTDLYEDSEGVFWVGTLYGLYELKAKGNYQFDYTAYLPDTNEGMIRGGQIQTIVEDRHKNLWVGTTEALNVRMYGQERFTNYHGGESNPIRSLLTDDHGNVWIGGGAGLQKLNIESKAFVQYNRNDGLKSTNFHRGSVLKSSTGKFFFGGNNGIDMFYPDSVGREIPSGTVVFSELKINNKVVKPNEVESPLQQHISLTKKLKLTYDQRAFTIDFVALNVNYLLEYTYCYMLEGFDKDWNCDKTNRSAAYTNIDPGKYTFIVKVSDREGRWLSEPIMLDIEIEQVFWKRDWAIAIYILLFGLVVYFLIRVREERFKLKNEIAMEKVMREQEHSLSEAKTQFFTNVAHEFRTPLSLILIPLERLKETKGVPPLIYQRILTAYKNASQMKRLVNELMDFNKLEAYNLNLHVQLGEPIAFIKETTAAFQEMADKRNILFSVQTDLPDSLVGYFDQDKLERIIFNILSNAFKFTEDGGEIKVLIKMEEDSKKEEPCLEIEIEDNGIGIAEEELPFIFEKFFQAKSSTKTTVAGTGIGLSLTKALVELHHGNIEVRSKPNQATTFIIQFPIDAGAYGVSEKLSTPEGIKPDPDAIFEEVFETDINDDAEHDDEEKPRILVVEDNEELREYLCIELQTEFTVSEAPHGEAGLEMASSGSYDLIISDIMMPKLNGIDFCRAIKSNIETSHIPFVLLTAKATVDDQITGIETGADLYISKPFHVRYLITHVKQIIAARRKLYTRFSQDVYLTPGMATTNSLDQEFLKEAIEYVVSNLQDTQLGVDSLASLFNLSRMQVYRKIKALTGKSVVEFIRMVRMKEAIKLMDTHKHTLSEISYLVGFNSASYFTKRFREEFGKTPSEYLGQ